MNNDNYFPNPTFPSIKEIEAEDVIEDISDSRQELNSLTEAILENTLRLNKGKLVKVFCTYPDSIQEKEKMFEGVIEQVGIDHLILSNRSTGEWYLITTMNINYIVSDEKINFYDFTDKTI